MKWSKEARRIAEKALGHSLDSRHPVHHHDRNPHNNRTDNLVICEDAAYHRLLHVRMRALFSIKYRKHTAMKEVMLCRHHPVPASTEVYLRGVCKGCYESAARLVRGGKATWVQLELRGIVNSATKRGRKSKFSVVV